MKVAKTITFLEEDLDEDAFEDMIAEELIPYAVKAVAFDITVAEGYGIEQRIIAVEFNENSQKYTVWEFNPAGEYTGSQEYNAKEFTAAYGFKMEDYYIWCLITYCVEEEQQAHFSMTK